jgi:hypothetical protein
MGGVRKGACLILGLLVVACSVLYPNHSAKAFGFLEDPRDNISTLTPSVPDVYHDVSFTLPADASPITPRDWIEVDLTNFSSLNPFTDMIGAFGTPIFTTRANTLLVHNVSVQAGSTVGMFGAQATNPGPGASFGIDIKIAKGSVDGLISNLASIDAGFKGVYISTSAYIQSPLSALTLSGYSGPGTFVTLTESGTVVGTASAQGDGSFNLTLSALDPGPHTYRLYSTDSRNLLSTAVIVDTYLYSSTSTSYTNILLSPTITVDKSEVIQGDTITLSGTAKPDTSIAVYTEAPTVSYPISSNPDGTWSVVLDGNETKKYPPGQHTAYAILQDNFGNSLPSPTINFTVKAPLTDNNPPPACNISKGDLNCDGKTNLTDFSILLFHWKTNHKKADINHDGVVNLVDFSIMMFYFKR